MLCDARQPASVKQVLITLVEHVLASKIKNGSGAAAVARSGSHPPSATPSASPTTSAA